MPDQTTISVIQSLNFHMQYFGVPAEIHTDSGCQFISYSFKQYCQFMGTVHKISSVRYPASNGLAERAIKTVKTALTAKLNSSQWAYRRRLKGIHSRSDTNRTGAEALSFYYSRLLNCLNQMLAGCH